MKVRTLLSLLMASLLLALGACESPEQAPVESSAAETTAEAVEETTDAADLAAVEQSVEESVSDDAGADDPDTIELTPAPAATQADDIDWQYQEGEDFRRLTTSQGTSSSPDKIEVAEMFAHTCGACYNFESWFKDWKSKVPADVSVVKIPAIWNPTNEIHARIMYTAEALDIVDTINQAIFNSIHQKGVMLTTDEEIVTLFEDAGVDESAFREAYGSFGVNSALKRAENLGRRYGIRYTPTIVVNGKYVVENKTFTNMIDITNELIERERRSR